MIDEELEDLPEPPPEECITSVQNCAKHFSKETIVSDPVLGEIYKSFRQAISEAADLVYILPDDLADKIALISTPALNKMLKRENKTDLLEKHWIDLAFDGLEHILGGIAAWCGQVATDCLGSFIEELDQPTFFLT